jgi:hypothetical protein
VIAAPSTGQVIEACPVQVIEPPQLDEAEQVEPLKHPEVATVLTFEITCQQ